MSKHTSLMEWLEQTRKLSKEEDYMGLAIIDELMDYIWLVEGSDFKKYKKTIALLCDIYHKPNPFDFFGQKKKIEAEFKRTNNGKNLHRWQSTKCRAKGTYRTCGMYEYLKDAITEQLQVQFDRYQKAKEVLLWQWFEIVDFMFERPELVDPTAIDEYVVNQISNVCKEHKKNNPLQNGVKDRFGKYWRSSDGKWHAERRRRF